MEKVNLTVNDTTLMTGNSFSGFETETKYGGLVDQGKMKVLRNRLFQLLSYLDGVVPTMYAMHHVVSAWRILQFAGPSFAASFTKFWSRDSMGAKVMNVFSVFYHLVPATEREPASFPLQAVYFALVLIFFLTVMGSSYLLRKEAKLPRTLAMGISIFLNTFMCLLHPIALQIGGECVSNLIAGKVSRYGYPLDILGVVMTLVAVLASIWSVIAVTSVSFVFRPCSLQTVLPGPQIFIVCAVYIITFVTAIGSRLGRFGQGIFAFIGAVLYLLTTPVIFMGGTIISGAFRRIFCGVGLAGCVNMLIVGTYCIGKWRAKQVEFFVLLATMPIGVLIAHFVIQGITTKQLDRLDQMMDSEEAFSTIKSKRDFLCLVCTGMSYAHPVCTEWSIFQYGTQVWENDVSVWVTYGKFVSIYPEEYARLGFISRNIVTRNLKGGIAKEAVSQCSVIQMQRENSLSSDLKRKLGKVQKGVTATKRRMRSIWDLVIQGNVKEMESAINNAYHSVNRSKSDFVHLLSQYPNNRFVTRAYVRFTKEVLGDLQETAAWQEKTRSLQRGIRVAADTTNLLGLHTYPLLPPMSTAAAAASQSTGFNDNTDGTFASSFIDDIGDDDGTVTADKMSAIKERIEKLTIPSVRLIQCLAWSLFIILMILPAIVLMTVTSYYVSTMQTPLVIMYYLSSLRTYNFQLPLWTHHWILETMTFEGDSEPLFSKPNYNHIPSSLGDTTDTLEQLQYILFECIATVENLGQYRSFNPDDPRLAVMHQVLYGSVSYTRYHNISHGVPASGSLLDIYTDSVLQLTALTEQEPNLQMFNGAGLMNPYVNANNLAVNLSDSLTALTDFISEQVTVTDNIVKIVMSVVVVVYAILWIVLLAVQLLKLQYDKQEVYRCLTALPKNVVSQMSEALRVLKKDQNSTMSPTEADSEYSKHEENLLKIFAAAGDGHRNGTLDDVVISLCYIGTMIIAMISAFMLLNQFPTMNLALTRNTPHLDDVMGTTAYMIGLFLALNNAAVADTNGYGGLLEIGHGMGDLNMDELLGRTFQRLQNYLTYYHKARYGFAEDNEPPLSGYDERGKIASEYLSCPDPSQLYESLRDTYSCFDVDTQIILFEPMVYKLIQAILDHKPGATLSPSSEMFQEAWSLSINLYDLMFYPMFSGIVKQITDVMNESLPGTRAIAIVILVVAFVLVCIIVAQVSSAESKLKFALRLLLQCPDGVVMNTPKIVEILSGQFSRKSRDTTNRSSHFFDNVMRNLPDTVIVTNGQYQVESVNNSFQRLFGIESYSGDIRDFFNQPQFTGNMSAFLGDQNKDLDVQYKASADAVVTHLRVSWSSVNQHWVIVCRNVTQTVCYNTLIREERAKSDKMLASILPASLVPRVQAGESNISFAVQSATISFMDIVEFTPWCAANTASMVMETLNHLYREFDGICNSKSTLTKVKCIGDCYMCAGGIFSEINQPAIHAREMVEFGLESIKAVGRVNEVRNQTLRIRVGVNTGGPIVAGVLGTEKPTFEILGPAINMAQQMEHNGVPMNVHISRSVYELVYGGNFVVKERGQIEIKQGKVVTYLVDGTKA